MNKYMITISFGRDQDRYFFVEGESLLDPNVRAKIFQNIDYMQDEMNLDVYDWLIDMVDGDKDLQEIDDPCGIKAYQLSSDGMIIPFIWHDIQKYLDYQLKFKNAKVMMEQEELERAEYKRLHKKFGKI